MIESGDFVDLCRRQAHVARERDEMGRGEVSVAILDSVQVLDHQITASRRVAEQRLNFGERHRIDRATLELARTTPAAFNRTAFQLDLLHVRLPQRTA
jgi:hypothetical protein